MRRFFPRRSDRSIALLLLLAFALAGWKTVQRPAVAQFSLTAHLSGMPTRAQAPALAGRSERPADGRIRYDAQFVSAAPGQAVHAASIVELNDGRLRAVWFSGSSEGAGDVTVQTAVMDGDNLGWGPESTLFDRRRVGRGLMRYVKKLGNPVIARAPDGSLVLWMVNVSMGGWAGSAISWSRSTDEGASWSDPRRLVTSPFLNISTLVKGLPVAMTGSQTMLPVYHEFAAKFAELLRLDAQGRVLDKIRIPGSRTRLQPVLLVDSAERARVYMRSSGEPRVMTSGTVDAGQSWSSAKAGPWPNPDSALAGLVTDTGTRWLALNPSEKGRGMLSLFQAAKDSDFGSQASWTVEGAGKPRGVLSSDDYGVLLGNELRARGASDGQLKAYVASAVRQLCSQGRCTEEFSYPCLLQTRDGYLHLVYTWHRTRIKHVRFDPLQPALDAPNVLLAN